ncbi:MAG: hypothetical protein O9320_08695 [Magnetospirillum sp.]|nr:hypothetical protein [Magnetospirillum sp.]
MIPRVDSREVLIFSLSTGAVPEPDANEAAHDLSLRSYMALLQAAVSRGEASSSPTDGELMRDPEGGEEADDRAAPPEDGKKRNILLLKAVVEEDDHFELFFQSGDAHGSVPDFLDPETGRVRPAARRGRELNAYSAHLLLRKQPRVRGSYPALLERTHLLSRSIVVPFLARLMRQQLRRMRQSPANTSETALASRFTFLDPDQVRKKFRPRLSATIQQSYSLQQALAGNEVQYIELLDDDPDDAFDSINFTAARRTIRLEIAPRRNWGEVFAQALAFGREKGYKSAQVRIRRSVTGKEESSSRIPLESENAAEWLFGGHETISGFREDLKQCADEPHPETIAKMLRLLRRQALWRAPG